MEQRGERGGRPVHRTETIGQGSEVEWIRHALHDLCQPLTALECGLFVGTMSPDGVSAPTAEELMVTIRHALEQCERVTDQLRVIQERINS